MEPKTWTFSRINLGTKNLDILQDQPSKLILPGNWSGKVPGENQLSETKFAVEILASSDFAQFSISGSVPFQTQL